MVIAANIKTDRAKAIITPEKLKIGRLADPIAMPTIPKLFIIPVENTF